MMKTIAQTVGRNWIGVTMSDLIDRQHVIKALYEINPSTDFLFIDAIVDMLENLPESKAKVKNIDIINFHCENCDTPVSDWWIYCPICGYELIWK